MNKEEIRQKREDEYATYEEYNDIFNISMNLNDENELLQTQLTKANEKLEKIEEYLEDVNEYSKYTDWVAIKDDILEIIKGK